VPADEGVVVSAGDGTAEGIHTASTRVLITNLGYVTVYPPGDERGVRTWTHALLLAPPDEFSVVKTPVVRGFGVSGSLPSFDFRTEKLEWTRSTWDSSGSLVILTDEGGARPVSSGEVWTFSDGLRLRLDVEDYEAPLDVMVLEEDLDYDVLWALLEERVYAHGRTPNMAVSDYRPTELLRGLSAQRLRMVRERVGS
jgi:hypothetical protein